MKYVLTTEQLEALVEDSFELVNEYGLSAYIKDFLEENDVEKFLILEHKAWLEGFNKASSIAFEALEEFKSK